MDVIILVIVVLLVIYLMGLLLNVGGHGIPPNVWNAIVIVIIVLLIVWLITGRSIL